MPSYPVTPPTSPKPTSVQWHQLTKCSVSSNPFTFQTQIQKWAGEAWGVTVAFDPMTREEAAPWMSFLIGLRGREGTFWFGDTLMNAPQGSPMGTSPTIYSNTAGSYNCDTQDWTGVSPGVPALKAGDFFQLGNSLYMAMQNVLPDAYGRATFDVWPYIRGHDVDTPLVYSNPKLLMRLSDENIAPIFADETQLYQISFTAQEVI